MADTEATTRPTPLEPFAWHSFPPNTRVTLDASRVASFVGAVRDVSGGVAAVTAMIEASALGEGSLDGEGRPVPKLDAVTEGRLFRLAVYAAEALDAQAGDFGLHLEAAAGR